MKTLKATINEDAAFDKMIRDAKFGNEDFFIQNNWKKVEADKGSNWTYFWYSPDNKVVVRVKKFKGNNYFYGDPEILK